MTTTLNEVLELTRQLSGEEQDMLVELIRKSRSEAWRRDLAAYVRKTRKSVQNGKLKGSSAAEAIAALEADWGKANE